MSKQPSLRDRLKALVRSALDRQDPTGWFETLYAGAKGDSSKIPWAKLTPHPLLQDWLDRRDPPQPGQRVLVVGCGLGDDAEALQQLGYGVLAFDIAPTAIAWCQERFPNSSVTYQVGDLRNPAPDWIGAFDLVVECRNVQALPLSSRAQALTALTQTVAPHGTLLVITHLRFSPEPPAGPPWPLSELELGQLGLEGFTEMDRKVTQIQRDPTAPPITQAWIEYQRR